MAIYFNGSSINNIYYNGTQLSEVYYNGTKVFPDTPTSTVLIVKCYYGETEYTTQFTLPAGATPNSLKTDTTKYYGSVRIGGNNTYIAPDSGKYSSVMWVGSGYYALTAMHVGSYTGSYIGSNDSLNTTLYCIW